jgi:hypothetical protein
MEGTVSVCNLSDTKGGVKEKFSRPWGADLEVHTAGWVNCAYI